MREIIGNTTATPNPRPDWSQNDSTKADYIKNKPVILTEDDVTKLIKQNGSSGFGNSAIESISVNGVEQSIDENKNVNIDLNNYVQKDQYGNDMGNINTALETILGV